MITVKGKRFRHSWPGKASRKLRPIIKCKTRKSKGRTELFSCIGGPFDGLSLSLYSAGTLPFSCNGFYGKYTTNPENYYLMEWAEL